ncbi:hypothetical protein Dsin_008016 [Dipteronia sinensis]|uniref:Uncharacterized protein n=1 Tax=Dipteronia sinensis TaxID=43782 RepID=A0AAE0B2V8_9ROSI|nr:hypothetical protein Dsin_008016 [Dipteronia sinensis]
MNLSTSQCNSSWSESGWTLYLDQSSLSKNQCYSIRGIVNEEEARVRNYEKVEEEEEEDLSMVSYASSGPCHYCEHEENCFDENACFSSPPSASELAKRSKKKKKIKEDDRNQPSTLTIIVSCRAYTESCFVGPCLGRLHPEQNQIKEDENANKKPRLGLS